MKAFIIDPKKPLNQEAIDFLYPPIECVEDLDFSHIPESELPFDENGEPNEMDN